MDLTVKGVREIQEDIHSRKCTISHQDASSEAGKSYPMHYAADPQQIRQRSSRQSNSVSTMKTVRNLAEDIRNILKKKKPHLG